MAEKRETKPEMILRALVDLIEELRIRRQAEAAECLHAELKTFSQRELTDIACPSYKNYLLGRTNRLPGREMILQIADYLECTPSERDELLICAGYLPESFALRDDQYQAALSRAQFMMKLLPLPAVVIGRYCHTYYANDAVTNKIEMPALDQWETQHRNVISYFFDPDFRVRQYYSPSTVDWEATARGAVELVYLTNSNRLRDTTFRRLLRASQTFPDFVRLWDDVTSRPPSLYANYGEMRLRTRYLSAPIRESSVVIPVTENLEVAIVVGVPADEAARAVYAQLGCKLDTLQWEAMLRDFCAA
jgi:hypothetical protein